MSEEGPKKPPVGVTTDSELFLEENIRRRPYELYEERGREDGHELDDWLRAEADLIDAAAKAAAKTAAA